MDAPLAFDNFGVQFLVFQNEVNSFLFGDLFSGRVGESKIFISVKLTRV